MATIKTGLRTSIIAALLCVVLLGGCASQESEPGQDGVAAALGETEEGADGPATEEGKELSDTEGSEENGEALADEAALQEERSTQAQDGLPDGVYVAEFHTDSGMFHVSEACNGKGTLTVENGEMTIHISLGSKKILNLYPGLARDAEKEDAELLFPTEDTVTYSDGMTEEVYGFDVPVPVLEDEFDLALIGTKGKWYDHKVSVSNPVLLNEEKASETAGTKTAKTDGTGKAAGTANNETEETAGSTKAKTAKTADAGEKTETAAIADGNYTVELTFEGGSGKAEILSPASICITDGNAIATIQWNSPNYDYMVVDGRKYLPVSTEGGSVFQIPVAVFDEPMDVIGDTVAMSKPHEVEYQITFHSGTLAFEGSMKLEYAKNFRVDYEEGGYTMLTTTMDGKQFLIIPEDKEVPKDLGEGIVAIKRPVENIYLVASSAMDMFSELGGMGAVAFSGQKEDGWYIDAAREAMAKGNMVYAGKYNRPDYELLVSGNCSMAIENMMISHSPEVIEKLEDFGIPAMIDYSSYESHPLGRVEWVKFYGALLGKEAEAEKIFRAQKEILERVKADEKTDKTVAFFFITSNGLVQVRQSSDYIPKMIEIAGGRYIFENMGDPETKRSTMNMQLEEFYSGAKDADFLIYNSSIDGGVSNMKELLEKWELLADFRAVQEGNVWCTTNDMYQQSLSIGYLMEDIYGMLRGEDAHMHYLYQLE